MHEIIQPKALLDKVTTQSTGSAIGLAVEQSGDFPLFD
jgi:hypothetical protein